MNKYGIIAVNAARIIIQGSKPYDAWEKASCELFVKGSPSQKKGCPRNAFLGLFDATNNSKNAFYARKAFAYLEKNESALNANQLWQIVLDGEEKKHNSQMNVVLALWNEKLI